MEDHILENSKKIVQFVDSDPWVLCKSKRYTQYSYFFNTLTGESMWNLCETELAKEKRKVKLPEAQKGKSVPEYPEPKEPPFNYPQHSRKQKTNVNEKNKCNTTEPINCNKQHNKFPTPACELRQHHCCCTIKNNHTEQKILPSNEIVREMSHRNNLYRNTDVVNEANRPPVDNVTHESSDASNVQNNCNTIHNCNCVLRNAPVTHSIGFKRDNMLNSESTTLQEKRHNAPSNFSNKFLQDQSFCLSESSEIMLPGRKNTENIQDRNSGEEIIVFEQPTNSGFKEFARDGGDITGMDCLQKNTELGRMKLNTEKLTALAASNTDHSKWFVVVETQVLLDDSRSMKLLNLLLYSDSRCHVMVPKCVMRDLGAASNLPRLMARAKRALQYLNTLFESYTAFIGPEPCNVRYANNVPILRCCLELSDKKFLVILLAVGISIEERIKSTIPIFSVDEMFEFLGFPETNENCKTTNANSVKEVPPADTPFVERNITTNTNLVQETQTATQQSNCNNSKPKTRQIRLKRTTTNVNSLNDDPKKKRFKWRNKKTSFDNCARDTTYINNKETSSMNEEKNNIYTQTLNVITSNTNAELEQVNTVDGHNLQFNDNDDSCEGSVVKYTFSENITVEEPSISTSNAISNTDSDSELNATQWKLYSKRNENDMNKQKNMYRVTTEIMKDVLRKNYDEWVSRFVQIMEEALTQTLHHDPPFVNSHLPPPWTLYEAINCIIKKFHSHHDVLQAATKLSIHLFNFSSKKVSGKVCLNMTPHQYMDMYSYGVHLIEALQAELNESEDIQIAKESLANLLSDIQHPESESSFIALFDTCDDHYSSIGVSSENSTHIIPVDSICKPPSVPPVGSTRKSPVDVSCTPLLNSLNVPPEGSAHVPPVNITRKPPVDSARKPPVDIPRVQRVDSPRKLPVDSTCKPQVKVPHAPPVNIPHKQPVDVPHTPSVNITRKPLVNSTRKSPVVVSHASPVNSPRKPLANVPRASSVNSLNAPSDDFAPPVNITHIPPVDNTHEPLVDNTRDPLVDNTREPPVDNTREPQVDNTREPPVNNTRESPVDNTREPPVNSTHPPNKEGITSNKKRSLRKNKGNRSKFYNLRRSTVLSSELSGKRINSISNKKKNIFFSNLNLKKTDKENDLRQHIHTNNKLTSYSDKVVSCGSNEISNDSRSNDFGIDESTKTEQHVGNNNVQQQTPCGNTQDQTKQRNEVVIKRMFIPCPEFEEKLKYNGYLNSNRNVLFEEDYLDDDEEHTVEIYSSADVDDDNFELDGNNEIENGNEISYDEDEVADNENKIPNINIKLNCTFNSSHRDIEFELDANNDIKNGDEISHDEEHTEEDYLQADVDDYNFELNGNNEIENGNEISDDEVADNEDKIPNTNIKSNCSLNTSHRYVVVNIKETLTQLKNFCVNSVEQLRDRVNLTHARKMEIRGKAEVSRICIHTMCGSINSLIRREENQESNIKTMLQKQGLDLNCDDVKEIKQYRHIMEKFKIQANHFLEALDALMEATKE